MPNESRTAGILWFGLLGLVVISFIALIVEAVWIEQALNKDVRDRIVSAGYERIRVETNGRDITLKGHASSDQAIRRLLELSTSVYGVRVTHSEIKVKPDRLPHLRVVSDQTGYFRLTGEVPDRSYLRHLEASISADLIGSVRFDIKVHPETAEPEWIDALAELFEIGQHVEGLIIEIGAGQVSMSGRIHGSDVYNRILEQSSSISATNGLTLYNRLAQMPENG